MLSYVESHYMGIIVLTMVLLVIGTWVAWLFSLGRFKSPPKRAGVMYVLADLMVKIIDDFRHLLALVLITIFAVTLAYAMYLATTLDDLTTSMQLVMSSLGGLVGSIVGYYFGESAVKKALKYKGREEGELDSSVQSSNENIQEVKPPPGTN